MGIKKTVLLLLLFISITFSQIPIAVIDFEGNGISYEETKALTDRFRNEMFKFSQYDMMERAFMEEILDEQGFQLSGCTSDACVVEVGKLIGVEQMIGGSISKIGDVFSISARIMSIETGQIVKIATYDHVGGIGSLLTSGMYKIAEKLAGEEAAQKGAVAAGIGSFYIISEPPGANIWIDDNLIEGITPKMVENISAGSHKIFLQKDNQTAETNTELKPSDIQRVFLSLTSATGKIQIVVRPFDTEIILDGRKRGKSPVTLSDIPAGHHTIRFQFAHYKTIEKDINVDANRTIKIDDELELLAFLEISSEPYKVDALINNMNYSLPLSLDIAAGEYQLQFTKTDFHTREQTIVLQPGERKQLHIQLQPNVASINQQIAQYRIARRKWVKRTTISAVTGIVLKVSADVLYNKYRNATGVSPTILHNVITVEDVLYPLAFGVSIGCGIPSLWHHLQIGELNKKLALTYSISKTEMSLEIGWGL